ncbi:GAF and ANTAR domain-containing protein [Streptomyces sp. NPDC047002]|uniref:GAF and ANTAR domain-containing protein n=1 Tax=Streptomyces sp. NPDC047002 TaxID=3155475 RepID=UPI00345258BF
MALLLGDDTLGGLLEGLAAGARDLAPAAEGCGITLERDGRFTTVVSVGLSAPPLDEKQYGLNDGPCLQALRSGEEVHVPDMLKEERWGEYPAYAAGLGTRASLSLPIAAHTDTAGALNLYSPKPQGFRDTDLAALRALAAQATGAIALAQRLSAAERYAADLDAAMRSRSVIDQAIGVIVAQQRCTPEAAFEILRTASQHRNRKLRDLCADLIGNISGRPPAPGGLAPRP